MKTLDKGPLFETLDDMNSETERLNTELGNIELSVKKICSLEDALAGKGERRSGLFIKIVMRRFLC